MDPLERAIADACLAAGAGLAMRRDLRGFLEERGVVADDVRAIVGTPAGRAGLALYRSLVRNGLSRVVLRMLPRTRARLNAACAGRFDDDLASFVDERGPRTHYLRDVPAEFFAWAGPRWRADPGVPGYLADLAAHELACFAVAAAESARRDAAPSEVAIDRGLCFVESARLERHGWAVHELSADPDATGDAPPRRDVCLLAYRDEDHAVRWLELTPLAGALVGRLMEGEPLGDAVAQACADHGAAPAAIATEVARLLADLAARGVVLGGA